VDPCHASLASARSAQTHELLFSPRRPLGDHFPRGGTLVREQRPDSDPWEVQGPEDVVGIDVELCCTLGWNADQASGFDMPFKAALAEAEECGSSARQDRSASE